MAHEQIGDLRQDVGALVVRRAYAERARSASEQLPLRRRGCCAP
jgi:hypothetical protein